VDRCSRQVAAVFATAALLASGGCGGEEAVNFKKGGPPAPRKCLERWNADQAAVSFGQHAYGPDHDSRAGRVFFVNRPRLGLPNACVVVFAASESDREYGTLGEFSTERRTGNGPMASGWQFISRFPVESQKERFELQRSGAERANVALGEGGELAPLD
jgi:hypothetical protein